MRRLLLRVWPSTGAEPTTAAIPYRLQARMIRCSARTSRPGSSSVQKGLAKVQAGVELIAVHDAARPCIAEIWIDELFMEAQRSGAAILATPIVSTVKRVVDGQVQETVEREGLWEAQTPQVCKREFLEAAYTNAENCAQATDEAQLLEWAGYDVQIVKGSPLNRKITTQGDMRFVEMAMRALPKPKLDTPTNPLDDMWR